MGIAAPHRGDAIAHFSRAAYRHENDK